MARFAGVLLPGLLCLLAVTSALAGEVSKKPLRLTKSGTAENPAVFDGEGLIIDLGTDVTDHAWVKEGDLWTSTTALYGPKPIAEGQFTGLFVDETPITIARDRAAERTFGVQNKEYHYLPPASLKPGQMGCTEAGLIYFRWPATKTAGEGRVILLPKAGISGVTIACSHIIVKNVTARYASNDGFNIHGAWVGIRLENIKAFCNADEGISAHDDVQMDVDGAEIAWNGSSEGGVADVNRSRTTYRNCQVHDNIGAAFKFAGTSHRVSDIVIFNQAKDFTIGEMTKFQQERVERR